MCIGIPMQVITTRPGFATVAGRGEVREVNTALIDACAPGDWLLVFLDAAREHIDASRAVEVNATLDLLSSVFTGGAGAHDAAAFSLPSAMNADQLAALTGKA